jgi:AcrR family transcriptional regulator
MTINRIAARAEANRSTFYRHDLDKPALLADYLSDLQAEAIAAARKQSPRESAPAGLLVLLQHIRERADLYRVMLGPKGDPGFGHRLRQISSRRYRDLFARLEPSTRLRPPTELRVAYISQATIGAIAWWLTEGRSLSPQHLATWLGELSLAAAGLDPGDARRQAQATEPADRHRSGRSNDDGTA